MTEVTVLLLPVVITNGIGFLRYNLFPRLTLPEIPTPPATTNAPEVVLTELTVEGMETTPLPEMTRISVSVFVPIGA